jgi:hypothetical protein
MADIAFGKGDLDKKPAGTSKHYYAALCRGLVADDGIVKRLVIVEPDRRDN